MTPEQYRKAVLQLKSYSDQPDLEDDPALVAKIVDLAKAVKAYEDEHTVPKRINQENREVGRAER